MTKKDAIRQELRRIEQKHGLLRPRDVVKEASRKSSPLHSCFTWDNTKAAYAYRLWQARQLIRVVVMVIPQQDEPVKTFISLKNDRYQKGGGYRTIDVVMGDAAMREAAVAEALADFNLFRLKWQHLTELAKLFKAADEIESRSTRRRTGT